MTDSFFITVDNRPVEKNIADLLILLSPAGSMAWLSATMGPYLAKRAKERFQGEGDDVVGKWAPLKPATLAKRAEQNFPSGPINRRTGELENWVVRDGWDAYPTGFGASLRYPKNAPSGELKKKVETAQKGKKYPNTVPRPVLGVNETDLLFFQAALQLSIEGALR